jgi:hypothetical protein
VIKEMALATFKAAYYQPIFSQHFLNIKNIIKINPSALAQLKDIAAMDDFIFATVPILLAKPALIFIDNLIFEEKKSKVETRLIYYLDQPLTLLTKFPMFLLFIDIGTILLHFFGFNSHIQGGIPNVIAKISFCLLSGLFLTRIKDFIFQQILRNNSILIEGSVKQRDFVREETVDELTSIFIWVFTFIVAMEYASLKFGFALGSLFACKSLLIMM